MSRHRDPHVLHPHELPPDESSITQYDSPSDSPSEDRGSSQSGHTTRSTSLHSGPSRRDHQLPPPVPVHAQGLYRADGMYQPMGGPARMSSGARTSPEEESPPPLRRAPSCRSVRGMYDPELHGPHPPPSRAKDNVSGDSLSYASQPEYVHYVNPAPLSGLGPYSWADSMSGTSQELYFRGHRKYFRRSFCSVCLSVSIVSIIIAVIGVVAIAAYLGVMTTDDSEALKYEMQYTGKFRVARGDFYHPSLGDTASADFKDKAERYKRMIETLYGSSYLSEAFRRAAVERFGNDSLTVFFRIHLDRRKIPTSVLNTEEAVRDVVTQEVMSLEPRAFRAVSVDIDSIEIQRDHRDGSLHSAPFIAGDEATRRQDTFTSEHPTPDVEDPPADVPLNRAETATPGLNHSQITTPVVTSSTTSARPSTAAPEADPVTVEATSETAVLDGESPPVDEDWSQHDTLASDAPDVSQSEGSPSEEVYVAGFGAIGGETHGEEHTAAVGDTEVNNEESLPGLVAEANDENDDPAQTATTTTQAIPLSTDEIEELTVVPTTADQEKVQEDKADATIVPSSPPAPAETSKLASSTSETTTLEPLPATTETTPDDVTFTENEKLDEPENYDTAATYYDEAFLDDVATELAPLLAAGAPSPVLGGVDRMGYVDDSAPANSAPRPNDPPFFTNVQVGTAYFGNIAPAPTSSRAEAPDLNPASSEARPQDWPPAAAEDTEPLSRPTASQEPAEEEETSSPILQLGKDEEPLYDLSPWKPIVPAFVQSPYPVETPTTAFPPPQAYETAPSVAGEDRGSDAEAAFPFTNRRPATPSIADLDWAARPTSVKASSPAGAFEGQANTRTQPAIPTQPSADSDLLNAEKSDGAQPLIPESMSIQTTLRIRDRPRPLEALNQPASSLQPTQLGTDPPFRPMTTQVPGRSELPVSPTRNTIPSREISQGEIRYRLEERPPVLQREETAQTAEPQRRRINSGAQTLLLDTPGGVDRLGIAFGNVGSTRRPLAPPPGAASTQKVLVVNGVRADATSQAPQRIRTRPTRPALQPVTSYSGVYRPSRPRPPSEIRQSAIPLLSTPKPPQVGSSSNSDRTLVFPSANDEISTPSLSEGGNAANLTVYQETDAPSREQLLGLFRLIALRYPALVANMNQQQLRLLLNDESERRKLLAPFLGDDRSRTTLDSQRNNTKFLKFPSLAAFSNNKTRNNRSGKTLSGQLTYRPGLRPMTSPRPIVSHNLNISVLQTLANITRIKVAGSLLDSTRVPPKASLSDRLHLLAGFPTRAPPQSIGGATKQNGDENTTQDNAGSREKLSDKLMRFHGDRQDKNGGESTPLSAVLRSSSSPWRGVTTTRPSRRRQYNPTTTRLPNSSRIHVIRYSKGESVQEILDKIFARFQKKLSSANEVDSPVFQSLIAQKVTANGADNRYSTQRVTPTTSTTSTTTTTPASTTARPELAAESDNEIGTADPFRPAARPTPPSLASLLRNHTAAECLDSTDFACRSLGGCIPVTSRCDRVLDCADGSDERNCTCADRLRAQGLDRKLCDGVIDCSDSSDEQLCEWCRPDQFICPGAKHCVDPEALCDGRYDCADGADERRCVTIASSATDADAEQYRPQGLLMVRRRGVWGRLCVDDVESVARQTKSRWGLQELGRAVCKALTYHDAAETTPMVPSLPSPNDTQREGRAIPSPATKETFYRLLLSPNTLITDSEKASLVFQEDRCPRQTALHVTCQNLQCGLRPRVKQRQARIVGGGNSRPGAWPWQAAMYRDGEYQCGATLISDRWLVSAGHCYLRSTSRFWIARLGAYRRGSTVLSPHERLHTISHIVMHPLYQDVGYVHDIALLRLEEPARMSDFVRPVCLPPPNEPVRNGALCSVIGWGQLFESGRIFPDTLQEVQLPLISAEECKKRTVFLPLYRITENMFCAGYERGGRDACLGDSGGPLMCQETSGEWTLTGVTSNGYGCARAGRPGVYTNVARYVEWIGQVTEGPLPPRLRHRCRGHRCPLGRCLPRSQVCDGVAQCADRSDEDNCPAPGAA